MMGLELPSRTPVYQRTFLVNLGALASLWFKVLAF